MRRFILGRKTLGHAWRFGAEIVNYADNFVIRGRAPAAEMRLVVEWMMERLRLPVNARKTRCLRVPEEPMEFLGYLVGRNYDPRTGACAVSAARTVRCRQRGTAAARAGGCGTPEPIAARVGELLLSGAGETGLRRHRRAREQAAAPVTVSEAQGEVREIRALPGREAVGGLRLGPPEGAEAQLRVSEGMISNESRVREIRTLGSMSGERKRSQGGD